MDGIQIIPDCEMEMYCFLMSMASRCCFTEDMNDEDQIPSIIYCQTCFNDSFH